MAVTITPWQHPGDLWRAGCYAATGLVVGVVAFSVTVTLLSTAAGLLVTFPLAVPVIWLLFVAGRGAAHTERSRTAALTGRAIADPVGPLSAPSWFGRTIERVRSGRRWAELGYSMLSLLTSTIGFCLVSGLWSGSLAMASLPLYLSRLPGRTAHFWLFDIGQGAGSWAIGAAGIAGLLLLAPWTTLGVAHAQVAIAAACLGPRPGTEMSARVARLETSRAAALDSAEAERRRIERDLHDGAQQRLVALAATLGAAREKLDAEPDVARAMVDDAHDEAKQTLREIRDLVRGIHPVILEDRGLDAALSAVVARSPIPVELKVSVDRRPPAAVESTAYFVVTEALTNVARHAHAEHATVEITRGGDRLVIEVRDDGVGGADPARGSGLAGLRDRVAAHGGSIHVISPPGGPTTVSVELPCGS